ncbi:MAG: cell division protein FtsZ [Francisellaceae bacterium]|jgi:cell division protein FtsZ
MVMLKHHGRIKIIGVGGGGGNTINHMINEGMTGVEFYAANTDTQALIHNLSPNKIKLGTSIAKGFGAGANPKVGEQAAIESRVEIKKALTGSDMVFITSGMGGGTGTGASKIIAEIARGMDIVTVGVVTMPFSFEGQRRITIAQAGLNELKKNVNSLMVIPNDKLKKTLGSKAKLLDAFNVANDVLYSAISSITGIIRHPGHINVDFADVKTIMKTPGFAIMGTGIASGNDRAALAVDRAISSELLEDINLSNAKGLLVCVTSGKDVTLGEFAEIGDILNSIADENAPIIIGTAVESILKNSLKVSVVATGLD